MSITTTFDPPQPSDSPSVFNSKAFNTLGGLNTWSGEANALAEAVNADADTATAKASEASESASSALIAKNAAESAQSGVSASATTATTKAAEAATSASDALTAKNAAEAAAVASSGKVNTVDPTTSGTLTHVGDASFSGGTVSGVTKAMVGLPNVDNTSDANKPVSIATQTALNDKVGLSGDQTIGGTKTFSGNVGIGDAPSTYGNIKQLKIGKTTFIHGDGAVVNWGSAYCNNVVQNNMGFTYATTGQPGTMYTQLNGNHYFYSAPIGVAGETAVTTLQMEITAAGNVLATNSAGLGYGAGSGGTATQGTSRTTGVTINQPSGAITLFSTTTTANQITSFTVTNSCVASTDTITLSQKSGTGLYFLHVTNVAAGSFKISVHTVAAVGTAEAPVINFAILKGVVA